jgi:aminoglycoside 6'-N-acetyltransferase
MSDETGCISLVDFDPDGHKLMLADWLKHPHARQWWGDPAGNLHQAVEPEPSLGQALIQFDERPVGYLRWQRLSRSNLATIRMPNPTDGVVDIDVLIGEPSFRDRGVAAEAIGQLSRRLLADPTVDRLVMCMSIENRAAVRASEKAGFVRSVQYEDPEWGPCWVLVYPDTPPTGRNPVLEP